MLESMTQFPAHRLRIQPVGVVIWNAVLVMLLALGFLAVGSAAGDTGSTFSKDVAPILFKNCVWTVDMALSIIAPLVPLSKAVYSVHKSNRRVICAVYPAGTALDACLAPSLFLLQDCLWLYSWPVCCPL